MESVLRGAFTYTFVWLIFRMTGKRTLAQITTFDAVLLLIISETTQSALIDENRSFTNSILLILTMLGLDVFISCLKQRFPVVERIMDGVPVVVYARGEMRRAAMMKERVDEGDILHAARARHGLGTLSDVDYAVLEPTGELTIVPKRTG